jgi:hypothetical protein
MQTALMLEILQVVTKESKNTSSSFMSEFKKCKTNMIQCIIIINCANAVSIPKTVPTLGTIDNGRGPIKSNDDNGSASKPLDESTGPVAIAITDEYAAVHIL